MQKIKLKIIFLAVASLGTVAVLAQKEVVPGCEVKPTGQQLSVDGHQLFYCLPKNYFRVAVTIQQIEQTPGPYANFAEKYLNISDGVVQSENSYYQIEKVELHRYSRPDSAFYYSINCYNGELLPQIQLDKGAVLLSINVSTETMGSREPEPVINTQQTDFDPYYFYDLGSDSFVEEIEESFEKNPGDTSKVKDQVIISSLVETSEEQNAKEAADFIRKLRKRRLKLLVGLKDETFAVEGAALQVMVSELDKLEEKYLELFVGKTRSRQFTYSVDFEPDAQSPAEQQIVGWFSPNTGISSSKSDIRKGDYKPLILKTEVLGKVPEPKLQTMDNSTKSPTPIKHGIFYRIPALSNISLNYSEQVLFKSVFELAQKGQVVPLSSEYFNNNYQIILSPETGGLVKIVKNSQDK